MCALLSVTILRPVLTWFFCYPVSSWFPDTQIAVMSPWIAFAIDAVVRDRMLAYRLKQGKWLDIKLS